MSDEEYQAMLQRLSAMREKSKVACAAKKAARAPAVSPAPIEPEVLPEKLEVLEQPQHVDEMPTPLPPPPKARSRPIATPKPQPKPQAMDDTELDRYFQAKYKWKTAYTAPPPAPPVEAKPVPMVTAVRVTAQDQIRNRVNDEVMKMAMKSVFPDWN